VQNTGIGVRFLERNALRRRALVDVAAWRPAVLHRFAVLIETMRRYSYGKVDPKAPSWMRTLIEEVNRVTRSGYGTITEASVKPFYSMPRLAELVVAAGEPKAALLHHLYGPKNYVTDRFSQLVDGLADYLVENAEVVTATLPHLHADGQERLINDLGRLKIGIGVFFEILFSSGVGTSKNVRKAARAILQEAPADELLNRAELTFASGSTEVRRETVELLAMLVGGPASNALGAQLEREKSKPVRDAITAALARIGAARAANAEASGTQSTYAWAYLKHATERRDYHANTIAKMSPDDPDRHVKEEKERSLANFARILARDILASPTETLGDLDARAWLLLLETCPDQLPEAARRGDVSALPAGIKIENYIVSAVGMQAAVDIALAILRAIAMPRRAHRSS
jgi:hypothetical protein